MTSGPMRMTTSTKKYLVSYPLVTSTEEYSTFNKNFENKQPKKKNELEDFLSIFDQSKQDPLTLAQKEDEEVVVTDFFAMDKDGVYRTESFYCTKVGQVRGLMTFYQTYMQFDPI